MSKSAEKFERSLHGLSWGDVSILPSGTSDRARTVLISCGAHTCYVRIPHDGGQFSVVVDLRLCAEWPR